MTDDDFKSTVLRRLSKLEADVQEIQKEDAVSEMRWTIVERDLNAIKDAVQNWEDKRASSRTWFERTIGGAVILAIVAFAMNGGFAQ